MLRFHTRDPAAFLESPETFRALKPFLVHLYLKTEKNIPLKPPHMKGTPGSWRICEEDKRLRNRKGRDFAMAFLARKVSGVFEERDPVRIPKWIRRMRISIYRPGKLAPFSILCCWVLLWWRASKAWKSFRSREKPHGTVCPPFWILTVEWAGARSCLLGWRHRFQIASFSPSTLENGVFKKHRFQIAPLWRAFSNDSVFAVIVFGVVVWTIAESVAKQRRFRLKTD